MDGSCNLSPPSVLLSPPFPNPNNCTPRCPIHPGKTPSFLHLDGWAAVPRVAETDHWLGGSRPRLSRRSLPCWPSVSRAADGFVTRHTGLRHILLLWLQDHTHHSCTAQWESIIRWHPASSLNLKNGGVDRRWWETCRIDQDQDRSPNRNTLVSLVSDCYSPSFNTGR